MWSFNQTELPLSYFCVLCDTRHWKPAQQQYASGGRAEYLQTFTTIYYKAIPLTSRDDFTRTDTDHSISSAKLTGRINSALLVHVYSVMPFFFFLLIQFHRQRDFCLKLHFFYYYFLGDRGEEREGATAPSQDFEGLWHKWTKPKSSQLPGFAHLIVPTAAQAALGPVPISPYASFVPRINYLSTKSIQPFPSFDHSATSESRAQTNTLAFALYL